MKKAQVSMEFLFAIGLIFFIFLIVLFFTFERRAELQEAERIIADKDECHKLAGIISMAFVTKSNHTFMLKENATISASAQVISVGESNFPCTFPVKRVSGETENVFTLSKGLVNVNYANSTVAVKNA
ncbi:MAG: hypothetical protein KJ955_03540 [Nanoarchaeota archaeon]|nr:hypothetical protein [Nanoarchaeota archaeon]